MDITFFEKYLPAAVITAVFIVIIFVYMTQKIVSNIEEKIEAKKGKQIKFFDHKKIWLNFIFSCIATAVLVIANFIELKTSPYYLFCIIGLSTFFYEAILKKLQAE